MDSIVEHDCLVEEIIGGHQHHMGEQVLPYKNHVYRVLNFCLMFHGPSPEGREKLAIAAACHDLGMWPGDEIDYLAPSIKLAQEFLARTGRDDWQQEISLMIEYHHRFRACPSDFPPLVEVMRKGDWVDATMGMRRFGLPKAEVKRVQDAIANFGFHNNLIRIARKEFWSRPLNPLPMMKW
ncbi:MAG: HD domain-containing protein [Verrucomicrobiota bacterium]